MNLINENFEWRYRLKPNDIINAIDEDNLWYEAKVLEVDKKYIKVRFRGWSEKWNKTFEINSEKISKRYKKVPDWINALEICSPIEISSSLNSENYKNQWHSAIITNINKKKETIEFFSFSTPRPLKKEISIHSDLIAEPYTHCGYRNDYPTSETRNIYLNLYRDTVKNKLKNIQKINSQIIKSKVVDDFSNYINSNIFSDIKFIFNDNKFIFGHKFIICSRSKYFNKMFLGNMKESNINEKLINDTSYDVFLEIIYFLYTGKPKNINNKNVYELLCLSNMYLLDDLKELLKNFLKKYLIDNPSENEDIKKLSNEFNFTL